MSLISVLKSRRSTNGPGSGWRHVAAVPGAAALGTLRAALSGSRGCGRSLRAMDTHISPLFALPRRVRALRRRTGVCSPPLCPGAGGTGRLWWGFPRLAASRRRGGGGGKQSQFICRSAEPFLWAMGFLWWHPLCNIRALSFPLPLFWMNPIIFIKKCYLWLLTRTRDANGSFLI